MQVRTIGRGLFISDRVSKPVKNKTIQALYQMGGLGHKIAKRSLRRARKIRVSELPDDAAEQHREQLEDFQNGYRNRPPYLRDIISDPGKPPLLHSDNSPLKQLIRFSVDRDKGFVVWGPLRAKSAIAGDLEYGQGTVKAARPWMRPSLQKVIPKLPAHLRAN